MYQRLTCDVFFVTLGEVAECLGCPPGRIFQTTSVWVVIAHALYQRFVSCNHLLQCGFRCVLFCLTFPLYASFPVKFGEFYLSWWSSHLSQGNSWGFALSRWIPRGVAFWWWSPQSFEYRSFAISQWTSWGVSLSQWSFRICMSHFWHFCGLWKMSVCQRCVRTFAKTTCARLSKGGPY